MREALDRLQETITALDNQLHDRYFAAHIPDRARALALLWKAKKDLWYARMHMVDAFAGEQSPEPTTGKPVSYEGAAAAYKRGVQKNT